MNRQFLFLVITSISATAYITVLAINSVVLIKAWLYDVDPPDLNNKSKSTVSRIVSCFTPNPIWYVDALAMCFFLWFGLIIIMIAFSYPILLAVLITVAAVVGGLYLTRWAIRFSTSLGKIRDIAHKHQEDKK